MTKSDRDWLMWVLGTFGTFAYLEGRAFHRKKPEETLTHTTRKALGIHPAKPYRLVTSGVLVGFCFWLAAHLLTGQWGIRINIQGDGSCDGDCPVCSAIKELEAS